MSPSPKGRSWVGLLAKNNLREQVIKDTIHLKLVVSWKTNTEILAVNTLKVRSIVLTAKIQISNALYPNRTLTRKEKEKLSCVSTRVFYLLQWTPSTYKFKHLWITDPLLDPFWGIKSTALIIKYSVVRWNTIAAEIEKFGCNKIKKTERNVSWHTIQTSEKATIYTKKPVLTQRYFFFTNLWLIFHSNLASRDVTILKYLGRSFTQLNAILLLI